ncbi:MAG: hypothetical protein HY531_02075 [Chloroflexi bacterium]|nr:hypothetical protein [Chloroflexota bacterium]
MKRIMKPILLLATVAAVAFTTIGTALAQQPGPTILEVKGVISAIHEGAATSTPPTLPTVTIQRKDGSEVTVIVASSTVITMAGLGKATLSDLAVDDLAVATYRSDNFEAIKLSVSHPLAKHHGYSGTIKSLTPTSFVLTTKKSGDATINVNAQTKYKVPGLKGATLSSFKEGDSVAVLAVDLKSGLMALHVNLIPGKPVHVHRVGTIESYQAASASEVGSITVKDKKGNLSIFVVTSDTKIKFKGGATEVKEGYRTTVVARRDPATDQFTAREILVFGPKS